MLGIPLIEWFLFFLLVLGGGAAIAYLRVREDRYLKKETSEVMSQELKDEIEQENLEKIRKAEKFKEELKRLGG